jgi:dTDP-4-amino-4,6-dideoxygalactose transaminase
MCNGGELGLVQEVLASGWLTTGPKTALFEERFAEAVNAKYALAVASGTAALHLALEAVGVGPGDKVFVPTMTFTATAEVVRYLGADPVFLDVDYGTGLITPEILREAIATHVGVKAFIPVHLGGQAADMLGDDGEDGLLAICRSHGIAVVEDAAHAFPARCAGQMIGSIGDVTCFSFYANKPITTGEGGMVTTNSAKIAQRVRVMRLHGIDRDAWKRYSEVGATWEYDVVAAGYKYNMSDVAAAIGLAQLEKAWFMRKARQSCAEYYFKSLQGVRGIDLPKVIVPMEDHAWHLFPIVLTEESAVSRNEFIDRMTAEGIGTSVHFKPLHRMTYYANRYGLKPEDFPAAEKIWRGNVSLPIWAGMELQDVKRVAEVTAAICGAPGTPFVDGSN